MKKSFKKKVLEYFGLSSIYWAWYLPWLTPYLIFVVGFTEKQYWIRFWSALPFQYLLGYWTVKFIVRMEPWFRKLIGTYDPCPHCGRG